MWTSIAATAARRAKIMYKNPPLYHQMTHEIDVKGNGPIGGISHTIKETARSPESRARDRTDFL